jgi:uridine phosphorylase
MQFGDLIVPTAARGYDGTSIHYGNREGHIAADSTIVEALIAACNERDARVHTGGVTSCEAIYRISESMMREAHKNGCVCMENGEAATTFAVTQHLGILGGVLFQPYIDLKQGWNPERLKQDEYLDTCRLQADVVLAASDRLAQQGTFKTTRHRQPFG